MSRPIAPPQTRSARDALAASRKRRSALSQRHQHRRFFKGITVHPEQHRRADLQRWLDAVLRPWFGDRVLPVSQAIAERWGILDGECQLKGHPVAAPDGLIAATALEHDLILVTRNVDDFAGLGIEVLNPWE